MRRPRDWFRQAELDFAAASDSLDHRHFEWACFLAQQSAEKAVKAMHESEGTEAGGTRSRACWQGSMTVMEHVRSRLPSP